MENTTLHTGTGGLPQVQTTAPHVTDNSQASMDILQEKEGSQRQTLVTGEQSALPPTTHDKTPPHMQVPQTSKHPATGRQPNILQGDIDQTPDATQDRETQTYVSQADAAVQTNTLLRPVSYTHLTLPTIYSV